MSEQASASLMASFGIGMKSPGTGAAGLLTSGGTKGT